MRDLAEKIADDLFGGGSHSPKAKHLRLYTEVGDNGRYMAGWSESPMATRIEHLLVAADLIPRAEVAAVLAELRSGWQSALDRYDSQVCENNRDTLTFERWQELNERLKELDATIAALGIETE